MATAVEQDSRDEIRVLLRTINHASLRGRPDTLVVALHLCFHDDMVITGPGFQRLASRRENCVRSYEELMRQATVRECRLSDPDIDL